MKKEKLLVIFSSISILFLLAFLGCAGEEYLTNPNNEDITFTESQSDTEIAEDDSKEFGGDFFINDPLYGDPLLGDGLIGEGLEGLLFEEGLIGEGSVPINGFQGLLGELGEDGDKSWLEKLWDWYWSLGEEDDGDSLTDKLKEAAAFCESIGGCAPEDVMTIPDDSGTSGVILIIKQTPDQLHAKEIPWHGCL